MLLLERGVRRERREERGERREERGERREERGERENLIKLAWGKSFFPYAQCVYVCSIWRGNVNVCS